MFLTLFQMRKSKFVKCQSKLKFCFIRFLIYTHTYTHTHIICIFLYRGPAKNRPKLLLWI